MRSLLYWLVLRPMLETPLRLVACFLVGAVLVIIPDLLLKSFVDADLPRTATAALGVTVAGAWLFLRASWRRRAPAGRRQIRSFAPSFANSRPAGGPTGGAATRTILVLDRYAGDAYARSTVNARARLESLGSPARRAWRRLLAKLRRR